MSMHTVNPATGESLATYEETSSRELDQMLALAHAAFLDHLACAGKD